MVEEIGGLHSTMLQLLCFVSVCRRLSVCMECIVAKRCVLEQKLLMTVIMRNRLVLDLCLEAVSRSSRSCQPLRYIRGWISRKPLEIEVLFQMTTNRKWHRSMGYCDTWPQRCCEAVRSAILATAWLLVDWSTRVTDRGTNGRLFVCDLPVLLTYSTWLPRCIRWLIYLFITGYEVAHHCSNDDQQSQ